MKNNPQKTIDSKKLTGTVQELLSNLKERPRAIIERRFGLSGNEPMVLGKIGEEFKVTRERIRQIENDSFKKLRKSAKNKDFAMIEDDSLKIIKQCGGFCEKRELKERIKDNVTKKQRNQLMFILNSSEKLKFRKGKLNMSGFWFSAGNDKIDSEVIRAHDYVYGYIKQNQHPVKLEKILEKIRKDKEFNNFFTGVEGKRRLLMVLKISRVIDKNILGEWGLKNWKIISQRGAREKAYIVLRKFNKPLHFRKITNLMNRYWEEKEALPQTVHNELIKDERFVLIGRGIYGLKDWGYPEGTVSEVIIGFLESKSGPIEKEEIIEYVLTKKQVKKTTVMVTLADRSRFHKTTEGLFTYKK